MSGSLPRLIKFWDEHEAEREKYAVLAFHDASAKTFDELDEKLKPVIEKRWGGRSLPFPILLDASGATVRAYGIQAYPTFLLIDPEGKLVRGGSEAMLAEKLKAGGRK